MAVVVYTCLLSKKFGTRNISGLLLPIALRCIRYYGNIGYYGLYLCLFVCLSLCFYYSLFKEALSDRLCSRGVTIWLRMPLAWLAKAAFKNIIQVVYYMNRWVTLHCALKHFLKKSDSKLKLTYCSSLYRNKKPLNTGNINLLRHGSCLRCLRNCGSKARLVGLTCHTASTDWVIVINVEKNVKGHYPTIPALYAETEENHRKSQSVFRLRYEMDTRRAPVRNDIAPSDNELLYRNVSFNRNQHEKGSDTVILHSHNFTAEIQ